MKDALFSNHLEFMARHRGSVRHCRGDIHIAGPIDELVSFVPASEASVIPPDRPAVRLAPWSGPGWPERLQREGYARVAALNYMELADSFKCLVPDARAEVRVVATESAALDFAGIQSAAFATGDTAGDDWWARFFEEQARLNHTDPDQTFYLGCVDGAPVSTALTLRSDGLSGIYAVATLPEFRRRGIAAAVLERARRDALAGGHPRLILQAECGSHAEAYYAKAGFLGRYLSEIWRKRV